MHICLCSFSLDANSRSYASAYAYNYVAGENQALKALIGLVRKNYNASKKIWRNRI